MKPTQPILRLLLAAVLAAGLCACRPSTTFADHNPVKEVYDAAGMDIPDWEGQFPVDGNAVLAIIGQATPCGEEFTPTTLVTIFDNEGGSFLFFFSEDRRHFVINDTGWRLTRRQAERVNKLI